jgi:hypothetical protein
MFDSAIKKRCCLAADVTQIDADSSLFQQIGFGIHRKGVKNYEGVRVNSNGDLEPLICTNLH